MKYGIIITETYNICVEGETEEQAVDFAYDNLDLCGFQTDCIVEDLQDDAQVDYNVNDDEESEAA